MNEFYPHSIKQQDALFSPMPITAVLTGIQWGKTTVGAVFLRRIMHEYNSPDDNYIVTAPSYKIMKQSSLPAFLKTMGGLGSYNKADAVYEIENGPKIWLRTGTEPDSIVGITNVRGIWGDEAGKYSLYFWENIQARASFKEAPIILTSSPYTLNWVYKEIVRPVKRGLRDDVMLIQASSQENPYFPKAEYERRKAVMDSRRFKMMYGGEWDRPEGIVYDCFDEQLNIVEPFALPSGTQFYGGIDWGYRDPFVFLIRAFSPYGDIFEISEFYKTGLKPSEIVEVVKQKHQVYGLKRIFCDPSRPDMIAELNQAKIPAMPADNDIQKGIDTHYELIKSRRYKVFNGRCPNLIDEYDSYHYPEDIDLKPDQNKPKNYELPVDQNNHCVDAARYISLGTVRVDKKNIPRSPEDHKEYDHPTDRFREKIRRQLRVNE